MGFVAYTTYSKRRDGARSSALVPLDNGRSSYLVTAA